MAFASLTDAMRALYAYIPNRSLRENYTLDRMQSLLKWLGDPQHAHPVIHIAGTSGKTSTAYYIRGLLEAAGARTALTVSPHITDVTERFQVGGQPIPEDVFLVQLAEFLELVRTIPVQPTYYELLIAFAFWYFARLDLDYVVIETGVGGRLDATNTVTRPGKLCVITDIGLDHTEILGDTVEQIAAEKAGIMHQGNVAFVQHQDPSILDVFTRYAAAVGATMHIVSPGEPAPGLAPHQLRNWTLARAAAEYVQQRDGRPAPARLPSPQQPGMIPPGRLETHSVGPVTVILDGAHNPQKLTSLVEALHSRGVERAVVLASFVRAPEAKLAGNLLALRDFATELILAPFTMLQDLAKESPPAAELAAEARRVGFGRVTGEESLPAALDRALAAGAPVVVITGSLYFVAQLRPLVARLAGDGPAPG